MSSRIIERALYELGHAVKSLEFQAHFLWLGARPDSPLPSWLQGYVSSIGVVCGQLTERETDASAAAVAEAATIAWREFEDSWQGDDQRRFMQRIDDSEPELIPPGQCDKESPLHQDCWKQLRASIVKLIDALSSKHKLCLLTGSLVAQVAGLIDQEQCSLLGEPHPIPVLRQALLDLQADFPELADADLDLYDANTNRLGVPSVALIQEKLEQIHWEIISRFAADHPEQAGRVERGTGECAGEGRERWTPPELAKYLGVSPDKVRGWIGSGELPSYLPRHSGVFCASSRHGMCGRSDRTIRTWKLRVNEATFSRQRRLDSLAAHQETASGLFLDEVTSRLRPSAADRNRCFTCPAGLCAIGLHS